MALTLIKEDGTGRVDANSYASAADGDAYHDGHLYATAWTGATTGNKERALVFATRLIDSLFQFGGGRAKTEQALQWPRVQCPDPDKGLRTVSALVPILDDFVPYDQVPKAVVQERYERLAALQDQISWEENQKLIGTQVNVLVQAAAAVCDASTPHRLARFISPSNSACTKTRSSWAYTVGNSSENS